MVRVRVKVRVSVRVSVRGRGRGRGRGRAWCTCVVEREVACKIERAADAHAHIAGRMLTTCAPAQIL